MPDAVFRQLLRLLEVLFVAGFFIKTLLKTAHLSYVFVQLD
jgi:hypothetical protein